MRITPSSLARGRGPADCFTRDVYVDTITSPTAPSRLHAASVHCAPGARTAWLTHPTGQTIYVLEGVGRCRRRGGRVEVIRPGDRVFFEPGEEHWHGAAPARLMAHLAMLEVDEHGDSATWGEHVTDEEYSTEDRDQRAGDRK